MELKYVIMSIGITGGTALLHPFKHLKTITRHHNLVMRYCFRCGLYWQGFWHDLSKLSPVEFWAGAKYYQGYKIGRAHV